MPSADDKLMLLFFLFHENRVWYFMQIVSELARNVTLFSEKKKKKKKRKKKKKKKRKEKSIFSKYHLINF